MKIEVKGVFKGHVQTRFPNKKQAVGLIKKLAQFFCVDEEELFTVFYSDKIAHYLIDLGYSDKVLKEAELKIKVLRSARQKQAEISF